ARAAAGDDGNGGHHRPRGQRPADHDDRAPRGRRRGDGPGRSAARPPGLAAGSGLADGQPGEAAERDPGVPTARLPRRAPRSRHPLLMSSPKRGAALALAGALLLGILASGPGPRAADLPELTVSVGGGPDVPAYLPVHVAASLDTFVAEGVRVTLRRAKHP